MSRVIDRKKNALYLNSLLLYLFILFLLENKKIFIYFYKVTLLLK